MIRHSSPGFTLLELLIAIAIAAMSITLVTYFTVDLSRFGVNLGDRLENQREMELTLRVIVSEVRSMGPGEDGAYPVVTATATTFTFFSDIDGDGQFDRVRYFLDGTTLKKGVIEPTTAVPPTYPAGSETISEVVHNVRNATVFQYYAEGYPPEIGVLPSPVDVSDVRMVLMTGTTDKNPAMPPSQTTLSAAMTIRNLRGEI